MSDAADAKDSVFTGIYTIIKICTSHSEEFAETRDSS